MSLNSLRTPTALDRLETQLTRLTEQLGFIRVTDPAMVFAAPRGVLLLTDDPTRNPEAFDACIILPEALKAFGQPVTCWVSGADTTPELLKRFGGARAPMVVCLRDGEYLGHLAGIRDWAEYRVEIERLLTLETPPKTRPIGIPVKTESTHGGCV